MLRKFTSIPVVSFNLQFLNTQEVHQFPMNGRVLKHFVMNKIALNSKQIKLHCVKSDRLVLSVSIWSVSSSVCWNQSCCVEYWWLECPDNT